MPHTKPAVGDMLVKLPRRAMAVGQHEGPVNGPRAMES
jgi:hypothetical protein